MKNLVLALGAVIYTMLTGATHAGIIDSMGREWEVRGPATSFSDSEIAAAADTEWVWATNAEWLASGFDGVEISEDFIGASAGSTFEEAGASFFDAWFANSIANQAASFLFNRGPERGFLTRSWQSITVPLIYMPCYTGCNRVSYRVAVPEPTTLALVGLSLAGVGWFRRKTTQ